ncbi:MAG: glycosyltransferase, partial [SAR324 cluster bacterium]|nr:glycosyltransferase [SAR324 cluster bacterium]
FKLAADFELWARFSRYAQLHTVDGRIGGFRSHSEGQRSRSFLGDYKKECLSIIDRERALNLPDEPTFKNAPPILVLNSKRQEVTRAFTPKVFPRIQSNPGYPKASVVTVCKKEDLFLSQCIESVLSQNYPHLEFIVINCGNSDTNLKILNTYKEHLLIFDSPEELSRFEALEVGLNHCSGEMMTWLWPEDLHNEKALLFAAGILFRNKDIEWIVGHPSAVDDNGDIVYVDLLPAVYARRNWLQLNVVQPFIYQESMFWKRSLWEKSGALLNTRWKHAADFELFLRFSRYAEVQSVNFLLSSYRRNARSRYSNYPVEYLQEVVLIVEQERANCPLTPFDEKVPPVPIVELK